MKVRGEGGGGWYLLTYLGVESSPQELRLFFFGGGV